MTERLFDVPPVRRGRLSPTERYGPFFHYSNYVVWKACVADGVKDWLKAKGGRVG